MRSPVLALALLDSAPDFDRLRERVERLTRVMPILRQRPLHGLTGLSGPRLAVDPFFDLDVHLRRFRLPSGAGWAGLLAEARRMSLTDFDRDRALWEAALVEGLPGKRAAFLLKLHHSIADGQATVLLAANLFELTEEPGPAEPLPPLPAGAEVGFGEVSVANAADNARRGLEVLVLGARTAAELTLGTLQHPEDTVRGLLGMAASLGRFASMPDGPKSPLLTGRGTTYSFAAFDLPFGDLRTAAKVHGRTINDVFLAGVAEGLDRYHQRHGHKARQLRFNLPISLRSILKDGSTANAVTVARFTLPVAGRTIAERLELAHDTVARCKAEPALTLAGPLADASWLVPVPMIAMVAQASDVTVSNVPGPPVPFYLAGSRLVGAYPLVATIGAAVNITMITYDRTAFVGVSADDRAVGDLDDLVADLRAGMAAMTGKPVGPADPFGEAAPAVAATPKARAVRRKPRSSD